MRASLWIAAAALHLAALGTVTAGALVLPGCGGPSGCIDADGCPPQTVCELDGTCRPLAEDPGARFARLVRLRARDWGVTRGGDLRIADLDTLELGGPDGGVIHLAFGPLPTGPIARATLSLFPHPSFHGLDRRTRVAVQATLPFFGQGLTRRGAPAAPGPPVTVRGFAPGGPRPFRFDVTGAIGARPDPGQGRLYLAIRVVSETTDSPIHLASPRAVDGASRPRLDSGGALTDPAWRLRRSTRLWHSGAAPCVGPHASAATT